MITSHHLFIILSLFFLHTLAFKLFHQSTESLHQQIQSNDEQCTNATHYEYHEYSHWAKLRYFNRSCEQIKDRRIDGAAWFADTCDYMIFVEDMNITCNDANMTSSFIQPSTVITEGGSITAQVKFRYLVMPKDKFQKRGYGLMTRQTTKEMPYTFSVSYPYYFSQIVRASFDDFKLIWIQTDNQTEPLTEEQKYVVSSYLFNKAPQSNLKGNIEASVTGSLDYRLKQYIQNSHDSFSPGYIKLHKLPSYIRFRSTNSNYTFDKNANNYLFRVNFTQMKNPQKCGPSVPLAPLDTKIYGGAQEFVSFTFMENLITYFIENKFLDSELSRQIWTTRNFKFTAGELAYIFSNISGTFGAYEQAKGACNTTEWQKVSVKKGSNTTFNVSYPTKCYLNISGTKIVEFNMTVMLQIQGVPQWNQTNLELKSHHTITNYDDRFGFKLQNKTKADEAVRDCLDRLFEEKLMGSGWPLNMERVFPGFAVIDGSAVIYDNVKVN